MIFADDPHLELIDYICVAMLLRIRWQCERDSMMFHLHCLTSPVIDADTNEALMLLMRYPSDTEHPPRSFVKDALYLRSHPGFESGYDIIKKYSDRVPLPFKRPVVRPSTPDFGGSPATPPSVRSRSPFVTTGIPTSFQSIINDATRGAMNRGEKWGFNQAVRDAVGEVKKNVQNLQAGRGSPLGGPGHRSNRSSESAGNIAANVLRKMTALEHRNKQLAHMLETAVAELWACEKEAADKKTMGEEGLGALSMAIAKVQFVQVFLQDSTLPLPPDENQKPAIKEADTPHEIEKPVQPPTEPESAAPEPDTVASKTPMIKAPPPLALAPSPIPAAILPLSSASPPPVLATTSVSTEHVSATAPSIAQLPPPTITTTTTTIKPTPSDRSTTRPRIEQSSYSWMLGQSHEQASDFARASPFAPTPAAAAERRNHASHKKDKGFLFGESGGDDVVGERRVVKGRTRKGSRDVRKVGSSSAMSEGSGGAGEGESVGEDRAMGDVKRGAAVEREEPL
jgi:TBC1 domain family protein 5